MLMQFVPLPPTVHQEYTNVRVKMTNRMKYLMVGWNWRGLGPEHAVGLHILRAISNQICLRPCCTDERYLPFPAIPRIKTSFVGFWIIGMRFLFPFYLGIRECSTAVMQTQQRSQLFQACSKYGVRTYKDIKYQSTDNKQSTAFSLWATFDLSFDCGHLWQNATFPRGFGQPDFIERATMTENKWPSTTKS